MGSAHTPHTRFTYHRTWEMGLKLVTRVTGFGPTFLVLVFFPILVGVRLPAGVLVFFSFLFEDVGSA